MGQISESLARAAKEANSFSEYVEGSATAQYNAQCEKARRFAEARKANVPTERHAELDRLVERYCKCLAKWTNVYIANEARCPSILFCVGGNFPVGKKNKQNVRRDALLREYEKIAAILDKIESYGVGGFPILADDADAIEKLKAKIADAERAQQTMKMCNAYYCKHKTMKGCEGVSDAVAAQWDATIPNRYCKSPYAGWELTNNLANIKRMQERVEALEREKNAEANEWDTLGLDIKIVENKEIMRLQVIFDGKPSATVRDIMKGAAFHWSPSQGAWQRQLTDNARYSLRKALEQIKKAQ